MRFKTLLTLIAFALFIAAPAARAQEQQQDQKVIDDFVTTRGISFEDPGKPQPKPKPKPSSGSTASASSKNNTGGTPLKKGPAAGTQTASKKNNTSSGKTASSSGKGVVTPNGGDGPNVAGDRSSPASANSAPQVINASELLRPIGLGYTVFMKEQTGGLLPVDPSREYKSGDRIAIALEPNTEGYIYIFNAENDRDPMMLFPNVQLDNGANEAHAHVRESYPSDSNYAFEFDNNQAVEHIYVIVSRRPLEGVPTGAALAEFCGKNRDDCYWKPSAAQWQSIKTGAAGGRVIEAKNAPLLAQSNPKPVDSKSLTRGIKIKKDEPAPAIVRVNDNAETTTLVTVIKLVHK
ncbi:MAG TPA: DUF4384 domain-containing protein [Pyrinomonadaceae bacterium]|nr:DUF4384 domain-containing protein [Pyrinomonadaceae bacterium]